ncbi:DUF1700 domain-containing protein [Dellaglioa sp. L3N]
MNKSKFIKELGEELKYYQATDIVKTIAYYDEMIDDRVEAGESEADIMASLEKPSQIAMSLGQTEQPEIQKKFSSLSKTFIVVLLILGSPLWGSLVLTAGILIATGYFLIWLVPTLAGIFAFSFVLGGSLSLVLSAFVVFNQGFVIGLMQFGLGFVMSGVGILCAAMAWSSTKYLIKVSVRLTHWLNRLFRRESKVVASND